MWTNRQSLIWIIVFGLFFLLFCVIINLCLTIYELEEHSQNLEKRLGFPLEPHERYDELPTIYIITPTDSKRVTQMADLARMRNTLWLVPKIFWILIEDSKDKTNAVENLLNYSKLPHVHLNEVTPDEAVIKPGEKRWKKPRGVLQRNKGLSWLRENSDKLDTAGVVYFADDDNTYDIRLFQEMRSTRVVSVWPVAFVGTLLYERPICNDGKVVDWFVLWGPNRPFPIDMAGFAINLNLLLIHSNAVFSMDSPIGYQESHILQGVDVHVNDLECKADNSTKIYVWHTNTRSVDLADGKKMMKKNLSYEQILLDQF